jgi:hypothetical protein
MENIKMNSFKIIRLNLLFTITLLIIFQSVYVFAEGDELAWPREVSAENAKILMYQPQIETFVGDKLSGRAAVSVTMKDSVNPVFGVVWIDSKVSVDKDARTVDVLETTVTKVRFPNADEENEKKLAALMEKDIPTWELTLSLDRLLVALELVEKQSNSEKDLKNDPPIIVYETTPSLLVSIDGEPILQEIENTSLKSVVNTPFFLLYDTKGKNYYLKGGSIMWTANELKGEWKVTTNPPKEVSELAKQYDEQINEDPEGLEMLKEENPKIIVATEPTELVTTDGELTFAPISNTDLLYVENSDSELFLDIETQEYFILLSGRWFKSTSLLGPWSYIASDQLPETFKNIPPDSPKGGVLSSVAGTEQANDAVLDSYIPETSAIDRNDASVEVTYDGDPEWEYIEDTDMEYAVNTSSSVIKYEDMYYCCDEAVWYQASSATGPWIVCVDVPDEIYTIPPSCPIYNVKYVYVYDYTPTVVYVGYYPGYAGSYVYGSTIVYGTGWYYYPWYGTYYYPRAVTWGFGVHYNPYRGWSFSFGLRFGGPHLWIGFGWHPYYRRGYWGARGYRGGYRHGYRHGYRRGYYAGQRDARKRNMYGNQNQRNNNIYNKKDNVKRNKDVPRTTDRKKTDFSSRNKNNVYGDKNGNVHRKTNDGWQQKDKSGWSSDKNKQRDKSGSVDRNKNKSGDRNKSLNNSYNNRQKSNQRHNSGTRNRSGGTRSGGRRR